MIEECLVVEFRVTGDDCPLSTATTTTDVQIEARPPQLRRDGNALLHFSAPTDAQLESVLEGDDRIRYLHASRTAGRVDYRCFTTHPCVVHELTDVGFLVEQLRYRGGEERHVGAVVGHEVLEGVLEAAGEAVGVTLERIYPLGPEDEETVGRRWDLTPAQEAALRTAHDMGYFSVPRETTASDVAAELGIGKSAFLERLRRGQHAIHEHLFA